MKRLEVNTTPAERTGSSSSATPCRSSACSYLAPAPKCQPSQPGPLGPLPRQAARTT